MNELPSEQNNNELFPFKKDKREKSIGNIIDSIGEGFNLLKKINQITQKDMQKLSPIKEGAGISVEEAEKFKSDLINYIIINIDVLNNNKDEQDNIKHKIAELLEEIVHQIQSGGDEDKEGVLQPGMITNEGIDKCKDSVIKTIVQVY